MKIDTKTPIWVVTDAGPHSTLTDVCFETDLAGYHRQVLGGLDLAQSPTIHTDQESAHEDACNRLLVRTAAKWLREVRGLDAAKVVRIALHGEDGRVLYEGDVR